MEEREQFKALPDVNVLKIGGKSVTDMGAKAVVPVLEEIVQNAREHKIIISTGGGTAPACILYCPGIGHADRGC